ncbi:hypothetical protein Bca52824_026667 [Brassica carinata]|uniref:Uncharacterized protein n=1 Tax=Brassica carinata TaxID=52824 RepID=A0A8X7SH36_BRACI|nr:hypothetical protein Bca52824_026667 [Brassica carinata]
MLLVMDIFGKLTGTIITQIPPDRILLSMASRFGFSGAASKLGYQSPKASTLLVAFCLLSFVKC